MEQKPARQEDLRYLSQSIQRTIDLLLSFTATVPERGITELSEALDIPKSAVHRIAVNLEMRGLLERNPTTEKYSLGLKIFELGMRSKHCADLPRVVRPFLEGLVHQSGQTGTLAVLLDAKAIFLDSIESSRALRVGNIIGQYRPVHCSSAGKILVAWLPARKLDMVLAAMTFECRTHNTITDIGMFRQELCTVRDQGYALDLEEYEENLCCISAPVRDFTGAVVAAVGISGPRVEPGTEAHQGLIALTKSAADAISGKLGYAGVAVAAEPQPLAGLLGDGDIPPARSERTQVSQLSSANHRQ